MPNLSAFDGTRIPVGFVWNTEQERLCEAAGKAAETADITRGLLDKMIEKINDEWASAIGKKIDTVSREIFYPCIHGIDDAYDLDYADFESALGVQGIFKGLQLFDSRKFGNPQRQRNEGIFIPSIALDEAIASQHQAIAFDNAFVPLDKIVGATTVIES